MALTVNTNIASLTAQRNLTGSQNSLSTSLQRLSSGLRINSAKDDAAGLAISERFNAQIRGLNQGVRNANDGISLAQTAEGALKEVTNNLQRIRELAVQSANATNSASDRLALQSEVAQLVAEIERVATNTKFNGIKLLDGTFTSQQFQVGAEAGETVSISAITSAKTSALGGGYSATTDSSLFKAANTTPANQGVTTTAILANTMYINGTAVTASASDGVSTASGDASALAKARAINSVSATTGVTATASTTIAAGAITAAAALTDGSAIASGQIVINGQTIGAFNSGNSATATAIAAAAKINESSGVTGVTADTDGAGKVLLTAADGRNIVLSGAGLANAGLAAAGTWTGNVTLSSTSSNGIYVGAAAGVISSDATQSQALGFTGAVGVSASGSGVALSVASVTTTTDANLVIAAVDNALNTVNATRSTLGAYQSRFESVVANLQTTAENLSASRSRIVDADFASETANLTKAQILQQSGIAMLAQANAIPQNVLALLQ